MNLVIYNEGSDKIGFFIENCVISGSFAKGTNQKVVIDRDKHKYVWTHDTIKPIFKNKIKRVTGEHGDKVKKTVRVFSHYNKKVSEISEAKEENSDISEKLGHIKKFKFKELDDYIDDSITDLPSAKLFIKEISKVVLALTKLVD